MKWLLTISLVTGIGILSGQACCTLQGFYGSEEFQVPALSEEMLPPQSNTFWWLVLNTTGQLSSNPLIQIGPGLAFQIHYFKLFNKQILGELTLKGNAGQIKESISQTRNETVIISQYLNGKFQYQSSPSSYILWSQIQIPLINYHSNSDFPFQSFPVVSAEIGSGRKWGEFGKYSSFNISVRKELPSDNLFQFSYQLFADANTRIWNLEKLTFDLGLGMNSGRLKSITGGYYQNDILKSDFLFISAKPTITFLNTDAGFQIRYSVGYPFLRWSNQRLPAGFSEQISYSIHISQLITK